jgi:hypothetical protein
MTNAKHFNSLVTNKHTMNKQAELLNPDEVYRSEAPHWWSTLVGVLVMIVFCGVVLVVIN